MATRTVEVIVYLTVEDHVDDEALLFVAEDIEAAAQEVCDELIGVSVESVRFE